jgi:1,4-alpha-glucan branching enzyme
MQVGIGEGGKYKVVLDALHFGGPGRVPWDPEMFSQPEGVPGQPETNFNNRAHSIVVQAPARSVAVYANMDDKARWAAATGDTPGGAQE